MSRPARAGRAPFVLRPGARRLARAAAAGPARSAAASRPERPPGHDRHPAGRPPGLLRLRPAPHPDARRPRRARRPLRGRRRPRAAHRALARLDPDRAHAARARRPRQRRLRAARGGRARVAEDFQAGRLPDRRLRLRLPAEAALRLRPRLRRLRRPPAARQGRCGAPPTWSGPRTARPTPRSPGSAATPARGGAALLPLGALLRPARALRGARRVVAGGGLALRRRDRVRGRAARPAAADARGARAGAAPLVLVTADHGESLGEHGEDTHGIFVYDATIRVPLILAGPGVPPARRGRTVARGIDVAPTLLDYAGLAPRGVEGRSLRRAAAGERLADEPAYAESLHPQLQYGWAPLHAWRTTKHKLIEAPRVELYDLEADPGEAHDRSAEDPSRVAAMRARAPAGDDDHHARRHAGPGRGDARSSSRRSATWARGGIERARARPGRDPKDGIGLVTRLGSNGMTVARTEPAEGDPRADGAAGRGPRHAGRAAHARRRLRRRGPARGRGARPARAREARGALERGRGRAGRQPAPRGPAAGGRPGARDAPSATTRSSRSRCCRSRRCALQRAQRRGGRGRLREGRSSSSPTTPRRCGGWATSP